MKYFSKVNPRQALYMSDGAKLNFEPIDRDIGIYPPEGQGISEAVIKQIQLCIAGQRGGVSEISAKEYNDLIQKKKDSPPLKRIWRPEFSMGRMPDTQGQQPARGTSPTPQAPPDVAAEVKPVAVADPPKATKRG